jgi:hypothetical protein
VAWLLCGVALAGACSSDEPRKNIDEGCVINTDCTAPLVCAFKKCHVACTASRDCPMGQRCMASDRPFHVCQLPDERICSYNSQCPQGQVCGIDGQCRDQCVADRDCLDKQSCVSATCADTEELVDGGLIPAAPSEAGASSSGIPCLYTSDCPDSLVCRNQICSNECLMPSDCAPGNDCVEHRCVTGSGSLIGADGGTVTGGKIKLTIPPHSLRSTVSILILALDAWPAGAVGPVYQIAPSGLQFDPPASLSYTFDAVDIGAVPPDQLKLANAVGPKWTALEGSAVDVSKKTVTAPLAHLSTYGLVGPAVDASVDSKDAGAMAPVDSGFSLDGSATLDAQ